MIHYRLNALGVAFVQTALNAHHAAFHSEPATEAEALTYADRIEKDVNFMARGKLPQFCSDAPKFILYSSETVSEEMDFVTMTFEMFDQQQYEPGDRA